MSTREPRKRKQVFGHLDDRTKLKVVCECVVRYFRICVFSSRVEDIANIFRSMCNTTDSNYPIIYGLTIRICQILNHNLNQFNHLIIQIYPRHKQQLSILQQLIGDKYTLSKCNYNIQNCVLIQ